MATTTPTDKTLPCKKCEGTGLVRKSKQKCARCNGTGRWTPPRDEEQAS